jgi:hypothetical protein
MKIPSTLADSLKPDVLAELEAKLAPPKELRAKAKVEFEIEAEGEGTFTIVVDAGVVSAKKGFAKEPLVSASIAKGSWPLIQRELQALVDGALAKYVDILRAPRPGEVDAIVAAMKKIKDAGVKFDVKNGGKFMVAFGPLDEATRVLSVSLDAADIERVLAGTSPPTSIKASVSGDRGVLTSVLAALGPVVSRLRNQE